jgi:methyl-accepting chemotaxis protein
MGLTSNLTAYDLGYIGLEENLQRLNNILNSMDKLKKYKGHFYNWYDTETMNTLNPEYISTVDSGNLVGYLWLISENLDEYKKTPLINKNMMKGICDTLSLANEEIDKELGVKNISGDIIQKINNTNFDLVSWKKVLSEIFSKVVDIEKSQRNKELYWNSKVKSTVAKALGEMQRNFPWIDLVEKNRDEIGELYRKLNSLALQIPLNSFLKEVDKLSIECKKYNNDLQQLLNNSRVAVEKVLIIIEELKQIVNRMARDTDFTMVYDKKRGLFAIGYDVEKDSLGKSYYDLLASEARQASFVA